jgi:hypothetical protein
MLHEMASKMSYGHDPKEGDSLARSASRGSFNHLYHSNNNTTTPLQQSKLTMSQFNTTK